MRVNCNKYVYYLAPMNKKISDLIKTNNPIYIQFEPDQPNMVIEFLPEIIIQFKPEIDLDIFFNHLDIAKNMRSIAKTLKSALSQKMDTSPGIKNRSKHYSTDIFINHADIVFANYDSYTSGSWQIEIVEQWIDFLNQLYIVDSSNYSLSFILISDYPLTSNSIIEKYKRGSKTLLNTIKKNESRFKQKMKRCKNSILKNYENKYYIRDIIHIKNAYKKYGNYLYCKDKVESEKDYDQNKRKAQFDLITTLCTPRHNYMFSDVGILLQQYGYDKLLKTILDDISSLTNNYCSQRLKILEGNIYYYNYHENYVKALESYCIALESIISDTSEKKCSQEGPCNLMLSLIYYEIVSVLYHLEIDKKIYFLNDNEIQNINLLIKRIFLAANIDKNDSIDDINSMDSLEKNSLIIVREFIIKIRHLVISLKEDTYGKNHYQCFGGLNKEMKDSIIEKKNSRLVSYEHRKILIARFIVMSLKYCSLEELNPWVYKSLIGFSFSHINLLSNYKIYMGKTILPAKAIFRLLVTEDNKGGKSDIEYYFKKLLFNFRSIKKLFVKGINKENILNLVFYIGRFFNELIQIWKSSSIPHRYLIVVFRILDSFCQFSIRMEKSPFISREYRRIITKWKTDNRTKNILIQQILFIQYYLNEFSKFDQRMKDYIDDGYWNFLMVFHSIEIITKLISETLNDLKLFFKSNIYLLSKEDRGALYVIYRKIEALIRLSLRNRILKSLIDEEGYDESRKEIEQGGLKTWRTARVYDIFGDLLCLRADVQLIDQSRLEYLNETLDYYQNAKERYIRINSFTFAEMVDVKISQVLDRLSVQ